MSAHLDKTMGTEADPRNSKINPDRIRKSASYRTALARGAKVLKKPDRLTRLVNEATAKIGDMNRGPIADARENLFALFRLLRAYAGGSYREASWHNLVLVVSALVYFVMPADLIPDIIIGLGYVDDAAILTWTVNSLGQELDRFRRWEQSRPVTVRAPVETAED